MSMLSHGGILILLLLLTNPGSLQTSFKCEECGKLLRNEEEIQMHATRTGHSRFSESTDEVKPLTDEQQARLEEVRKQKASERVEREREEYVGIGKIRRKTGKERSAIRKEAMRVEALKAAAEVKRQKMENRERIKKIRALIAEDRARANKEAEQQQEKNNSSQPARTKPSPTTASTSNSEGNCRLQFRCKDGRRLVETFQSTDTWDQVLRKMGMENKTFMTSYPKKVYGSEERSKTLQELGMGASAVLIETQDIDHPTNTSNVTDDPPIDWNRVVDAKPIEEYRPMKIRGDPLLTLNPLYYDIDKLIEDSQFFKLLQRYKLPKANSKGKAQTQ